MPLFADSERVLQLLFVGFIGAPFNDMKASKIAVGKSGCRLIVLWLSALLLISALIALPIGSRAVGVRNFDGEVADIIPSSADFPDWVFTERAIADTPEMQRAVAELLNFDQGVYREFERAGVRISIYLTYWSPGRMSQRSVGGHTPDVCWVAAGWGNLLEQASTINYEVGGSRGIVMQSRVFKFDGLTEYVAFAQIVAGRSLAYGDGRGPEWYSLVMDLIRNGFSQREEQFFIRISSNRPISQILSGGPAERSLSNLGAVLELSRNSR